MGFTAETSLDNLCRTCMREGKTKTFLIFDEIEHAEDENNKITIIELLSSTIPSLNVDTDSMLPKILCEDCVGRLIDSYEFQRMCLEAEEKFTEIFNERSTLKIQVLVDPLDEGPAVNDFTDILEEENDDPLIEKDVPFFDVNEDDKDVNFATEESHLSSDISAKFEGDITSEGSEWEYHTMDVSKSKKLAKTMEKKVRNVSFEKEEISIENSNNINKNFVCDYCGKRLKSEGYLKRHKKIVHQGPTPYKRIWKHKCEFCQKAFQRPKTLKEHMRMHTGEKPYLCSECGKAFSSRQNMQQHLLRHGTNKPYECSDCPQRFRCASDLTSHKKVHNKKKTHICDVCGSGFSIPSLLKKHKRFHTGERNYKCDFCDMRFFLAYHCRRHMRTHTGEKPYKCQYCERCFPQSNDLIKHLRVHLGDNVYTCDLCPQGYPLLRDLRAHFYTHKNDDEETKIRNLQALKEEEQKIKEKFGLTESK